MILSRIYIGGVVVLETWPVYTLFMAGFQHRALASWQWTGIVLSFVGVAVLMGAAVILPMRVGLKKMTEREL